MILRFGHEIVRARLDAGAIVQVPIVRALFALTVNLPHAIVLCARHGRRGENHDRPDVVEHGADASPH